MPPFKITNERQLCFVYMMPMSQKKCIRAAALLGQCGTKENLKKVKLQIKGIFSVRQSRFLGDPVKKKKDYRKIKDINKKKEVSRRSYLLMFYYQIFFEALIHSPLAPETQKTSFKNA